MKTIPKGMANRKYLFTIVLLTDISSFNFCWIDIHANIPLTIKKTATA